MLLASEAIARGDIVPFSNEAAPRGIAYSMMAYPPISGFYGFGCALADLDADGDEDAVLLGAASGQVGIYENVGGSFVDRSGTSGIFPMTSLSSMAIADYDRDGDEDMFLSRVLEPSLLFRNDGGFHFTDVTLSAGIDTQRMTKGACWGDCDGDGDVDLFLCNYVLFFAPPEASRNQLYRNNGDGTFTDVAPELGLDDDGASLQAVWTDFDRDGDADLYLSNDRGPGPTGKPNRLYRNEGDGTFTEIGDPSGAGVRLCSMGLACGDVDGNGLVDLYCTNKNDTTPPPLFGAFPLLLQASPGTFGQGQEAWGVAHPTATWGWGSTFFDWNNDGLLDLYVHDQFAPNSLFENRGSPPLVDVAAEAGIAGSSNASYCSAFGDVDDDGDIDVLMNSMGENVSLYINNEGGRRGGAIRFRVTDLSSRSAAVGASVELVVGGVARYRESYAGGNGYLGQSAMSLHVGLGEATVATSGIVRWPANGPVRTFSSIPAGCWTIHPPARLGDVDADGDVDLDDRTAFCAARGPVVSGTEILDFDGDFTIGAGDVAEFRDRYVTPKRLWSDLDLDGTVNAADLAVLLGAWGSPDCAADLDGDGTVAAADLSLLLGDWQ